MLRDATGQSAKLESAGSTKKPSRESIANDETKHEAGAWEIAAASLLLGMALLLKYEQNDNPIDFP
jgi:hypothetical protein